MTPEFLQQLDKLSDLWIEAELSGDPAPLFDALHTSQVVSRIFYTHWKPRVFYLLRKYSGTVQDPEDWLQEYWLVLFRHWENIVPRAYLINTMLHFYARRLVHHALRSAQVPQRRAPPRDWHTPLST